MHHLRLTLTGPAPARERLADELQQHGATRLDGAGPLELVWSTPGRADDLTHLAAHHPAVSVGVERFEALGDERVRALVCGGALTVMERRDLNERYPYGDEGGEPFDPQLLRGWAQLVEACPPSFVVTTPLASVLELGRAMGRLCGCANDATAGGAPDRPAISSLLDLGSLASTIGATTASMHPAERVVARSWTLTEALAHAAAAQHWDRPGSASWADWISLVVRGVCDVIDAGCHCASGVAPHLSSQYTEHWGSDDEQLRGAAKCLLVTCLEALVLFGDVDASAGDDRACGSPA